MCESTAYIKKGKVETVYLKDVVKIIPRADGKMLVENILGEQKIFSGVILEIDFREHKIVLVEGI
jgi:predicted RNA-binding protein